MRVGRRRCRLIPRLVVALAQLTNGRAGESGASAASGGVTGLPGRAAPGEGRQTAEERPGGRHRTGEDGTKAAMVACESGVVWPNARDPGCQVHPPKMHMHRMPPPTHHTAESTQGAWDGQGGRQSQQGRLAAATVDARQQGRRSGGGVAVKRMQCAQ